MMRLGDAKPRTLFFGAVAGGVVAAMAVAIVLSQRSHGGRELASFESYINMAEVRDYPVHFRCGVFLGTGWSDAKAAEQLPQWEAEGRWFNPFTGQRFDARYDGVFAFGVRSVLMDVPRVTFHHLGLRLSSVREISGYSFDYIVCHSNGCTEAFQALNSGAIRASYVFAFGADTKAENLPGGLRGARVIYFVVKGDPIPKSSAITLGRAGSAPAVQIRIPLGRGGPDVVVLERPPGSPPHSLVDAYLPAIRKWMRQHGAHPIAAEIEKFLRQLKADSGDPAESATDRRDRTEGEEDEETPKAHRAPPGCPPHCPPRCPPDCPPTPLANGPPHYAAVGAADSNRQSRPALGGVSAPIAVDRKDFQRLDPSKGR